MAKGQHLSRHQQGIVKRYYSNLDTISLTRLAETVSDLYLCTDPKKAERLWQGVGSALDKIEAGDRRVHAILEKRSVVQLASLVNELMGKK